MKNNGVRIGEWTSGFCGVEGECMKMHSFQYRMFCGSPLMQVECVCGHGGKTDQMRGLLERGRGVVRFMVEVDW